MGQTTSDAELGYMIIMFVVVIIGLIIKIIVNVVQSRGQSNKTTSNISTPSTPVAANNLTNSSTQNTTYVSTPITVQPTTFTCYGETGEGPLFNSVDATVRCPTYCYDKYPNSSYANSWRVTDANNTALCKCQWGQKTPCT